MADRNTKAHWQKIYSTSQTNRVGWYAPHLSTSLTLIQSAGVPQDARIIDVGAGASTLGDDLLERGYRDLAVVDFSGIALNQIRSRLGKHADHVNWIEGDITTVTLPGSAFDIWHDRAVFHFLTRAEQRASYARQLHKALKVGGQIIIGTFSTEAPPKCSGLPVQRYTSEQLHRELGEALILLEHQTELHITPGGVEQSYIYCRFEKVR
jgi:SAM-dependent methyltransferase